MQRVPTWRGSRPAVDDGAGAGLGHRPGLDQRKAEARLERLLMAWIDAGAEAEAHAVRRLGVLRRRAAAGSPASRRDSG